MQQQGNFTLTVSGQTVTIPRAKAYILCPVEARAVDKALSLIEQARGTRDRHALEATKQLVELASHVLIQAIANAEEQGPPDEPTNGHDSA